MKKELEQILDGISAFGVAMGLAGRVDMNAAFDRVDKATDLILELVASRYDKVNRVELIEWREGKTPTGRLFVAPPGTTKVKLDLQDNNKTLKVFLVDNLGVGE